LLSNSRVASRLEFAKWGKEGVGSQIYSSEIKTLIFFFLRLVVRTSADTFGGYDAVKSLKHRVVKAVLTVYQDLYSRRRGGVSELFYLPLIDFLYFRAMTNRLFSAFHMLV